MQEEISWGVRGLYHFCWMYSQMQEVKIALSQKFDIKDMEKLHHFLGMVVMQDDNKRSVWIGQPAYTENLKKKFRMQDCKPFNTPLDTSSKVVYAMEQGECIDQSQYQSAIGSLMYFSVSTRPDIAYAVGNLARFSSKPTKEHWTAFKRVTLPKRNHQAWYTLQPDEIW